MSTIAALSFLVHPYCYAGSLGTPAGWETDRWQAYHAREETVEDQWYALIDGAAADELVVYHPCFESAEERELAAHGAEKLGARWLRLGARETLYTPEAMAALAPRIEAAFAARGKYDWCVHDLRIAAFSWHYARDIAAHLQATGLALAPRRLRTVGESFEGCTTTWTTMLPDFLGTASRVVIPFEATVPDTHFLLACEYLGRHELDHDTALYLFVDPAGRPVAHYKRERVTLADTHRWARLALPAAAVSVLDGDGQARGIDAAGPVRGDDASVTVMVATGRRYRDPGSGPAPEAPLFLLGAAGDVAGFTKAARAARITATPVAEGWA